MHDEEPFVPGHNAPDVNDVLEAAKAEQSRKPLQAYIDAIVELRDNKGFSFREIAEWLSKNVVKTDHNMVYREYRKHQKKRQEYHEREYGGPFEEPDPHVDDREEETAED